MMPGPPPVSRSPVRHRLRPGAEPVRVGRVLVLPAVPVRRRERGVDARPQELHHEPARVPNAVGVGPDLHPGLDRARARGDERASSLDLDHADPARVDRRQVVARSTSWGCRSLRAARVEDRRTLRDADGDTVDLRVQQPCAAERREPRSCAVPVEQPERRDRRTHRTGRRLSQAADRSVAHHVGDIFQQRELVRPRSQRASGDRDGAAPLPVERSRPGRARTARTIRRGRTARSAGPGRPGRCPRRRP